VAVSPACSADRQRVLVWDGARLPFMMMDSVICHRPGSIPSAAADSVAAPAQNNATGRSLAAAVANFWVIRRPYRACGRVASGRGPQHAAHCSLRLGLLGVVDPRAQIAHGVAQRGELARGDRRRRLVGTGLELGKRILERGNLLFAAAS
jgi:hypothetical protein